MPSPGQSAATPIAAAPGFLALCFAESPGLLDSLADSSIPIAVTGSWVKDGHRFSITKEDLDDMVRNFNKRGNGQVVIDYEHASERPEVAQGGPIPASGWIHQLSVKHDSDEDRDTLWASVEWTPKAKDSLKAGEYRYFSPAIDWGATDKKTGRGKGATLTSGALTNHPFLEELPAITMSEAGSSKEKTIHVPVVDGAKIKVKVDAKHDDDHELTDVSHGDQDAAIREAVRTKYQNNLSYPDMCSPNFVYTKDIFDDYLVVEANGKLFKIAYKVDSKGNVTLDSEPEQVVTTYVAAAETSGKVTRAEGDGDHPASHYLVVPDAKKSSTWGLRVKNAAGDVDHGLMGAAWAALHEGYRGNKYEGPGKAEALKKLKALYKSEKMKTPDEKTEASEVSMEMTNEQFATEVLKRVTLLEGQKKSVGLCSEIRAAFDAKDLRRASGLTLTLLDDMDSYGVEGDRGEQDKLRSQAESRAKKVDTKSDGDDTEMMSSVEDDDEDDTDAPTVPRMRIRQSAAEDKLGNRKRHAIVGKDGKLHGYISHGDLMKHAAKFTKGDTQMKASELIEQELKARTGRTVTLSEATTLIERGITAGDGARRSNAHKTLLSTVIRDTGEVDTRAARRLLAEEKITQIDFADFEDAREDVEKAVLDGRFIPRQRGALIGLCLADRKSFEALTATQPKSNRTEQAGIGGSGQEGNVDHEVNAKVNALLKDNKEMSYGTAFTQVLASDTGLAKRYRTAHTKLM